MLRRATLVRAARPTLAGTQGAARARKMGSLPASTRSRTGGKAVIVAGVVLGLTLSAAYLSMRSIHADLVVPLPELRPVEPVKSDDGYLRLEQVAQQDGKDGRPLWVVLHGEVYDLTCFKNDHPGGPAPILKAAGTDATEIYDPIHPADALEALPPEAHVGTLHPSSTPAAAVLSKKQQQEEIPDVGSMLNMDDFERAAKKMLSEQAWAYYSSAGDDEITMRANRAAYARVYFRPRILVPIGSVDPTTTLLGHTQMLPFYISPAAMAKLGHPDGELNLTRAAGKNAILQGISANASVSLDDILAARQPGQPVVYQLYVNRDRAASEKILRKIELAGVDAIMLTVDAPVMGKRERDMRAKGEEVKVGGDTGTSGAGAGVAAAISGYIDPNLSWKDIAWIRSVTKLPLFLKGIQCVEDVELAAEHGIDGVVLSNHGGRSLDYSPPPLDVLIELRQRRPDLIKQSGMLVFIDGGIRRGTDVLKALALGAHAVGLGRPFLYAQSGFGEAGAARAIEILRDEIERDMRLLGITRLDELGPHMVDILPRTAYQSCNCGSRDA